MRWINSMFHWISGCPNNSKSYKWLLYITKLQDKLYDFSKHSLSIPFWLKMIYKSKNKINACKILFNLNISFAEYLPYSFIFRIIVLGYKKPLEREDLFELNESDSSYIVCPIFEKQWRKEVLRNQERQEVKVINS